MYRAAVGAVGEYNTVRHGVSNGELHVTSADILLILYTTRSMRADCFSFDSFLLIWKLLFSRHSVTSTRHGF